MTSVSDAVKSLRPNTEWTMNGEDIEGIIWHTPGVEPLTIAEVRAEMERMDEIAEQQKAAEEAARQAAISHAKSLGFTDEMIAVMYPNLISK